MRFSIAEGTTPVSSYSAPASAWLTHERPAVTVSKVHGLAVIGTSLVLDGEIVGAAVAGYVLLDFSQLSEIQRVAKDAKLDFARGMWPASRVRYRSNG